MVPEDPQVAGYGDRRLRQFRDGVLIRQALDCILGGEQSSEFLILEADKAQIEALVPSTPSTPTRSGLSSHPAFSASWLSAMMYARFCASLK